MSVELFRVGLNQVVKTAGQTGVTPPQVMTELARTLAAIIALNTDGKQGQILHVYQSMQVIKTELDRFNGTA